MKGLSWTSFVLAAWLIFAPFILRYRLVHQS